MMMPSFEEFIVNDDDDNNNEHDGDDDDDDNDDDDDDDDDDGQLSQCIDLYLHVLQDKNNKEAYFHQNRVKHDNSWTRLQAH